MAASYSGLPQDEWNQGARSLSSPGSILRPKATTNKRCGCCAKCTLCFLLIGLVLAIVLPVALKYPQYCDKQNSTATNSTSPPQLDVPPDKNELPPLPMDNDQHVESFPSDNSSSSSIPEEFTQNPIAQVKFLFYPCKHQS